MCGRSIWSWPFVAPQNRVKPITQDLEDLRHDLDPNRTGQPRIWKSPEECPGNPPPCNWKEGRCTVCLKRRDITLDTNELLEIAELIESGMPLSANALTSEQWLLVGEIRRWRHPKWQM